MNNSITKLKDFELDEISGGVTAKQVGKKVAAYAIKGACAIIPACLVLGAEFSFLGKKANDREISGFRYTPKKITISELFGFAFSVVLKGGGILPFRPERRQKNF